MTKIANRTEFNITPDLKGVIIERMFGSSGVTIGRDKGCVTIGRDKGYFLLLCSKRKIKFFRKLSNLIFKHISGETLYRRRNITMFNGKIFGVNFLNEDEVNSLKQYNICLGIDTYGLSTSLNISIERNILEIKRLAKEFIELAKSFNFSTKIIKFVEQIKN